MRATAAPKSPAERKRRERELVLAVRAIYQELAQRPVERQCSMQTQCCRFRLTGKTPYLTAAEALVAAKAWKATGRKTLPQTSAADGACPLLEPETGRCRIYADRPFGCRTHFCEAAGGPYRRAEVADLIHRLEDLSRSAQGGATEARPLAAAVAQALLDHES